MSPHRRVRRGCGGRQRGVATVEFAIGSLVIFALMFAAAEIGRVFYSYNTLVKSVRAGSRYLSTVALNSASVMDLDGEKRGFVANLVANGDLDGRGRPLLEGLTGEDVEIGWEASSRSTSRYVKVSATFEYRPLFGSMPGLGSAEGRNFGFEMRASSTMPVVR